MIAVIVVGSRLICSASAWQIVCWLLVASFCAPFAAYIVRDGRRDLRRAAILGLAIVLLVTVLVATSEAVPIRDTCVTCRENFPQWVCWLQGCW